MAGCRPRQVCAFYRRMGYDFLSLTDHFLDQYELADCGYPAL